MFSALFYLSSGLIIGFIIGMLVGRKNPKKADILASLAKKTKEEINEIIEKIRK